MAERSIAPVLKTGMGNTIGGSNPSPTAMKRHGWLIFSTAILTPSALLLLQCSAPSFACAIILMMVWNIADCGRASRFNGRCLRLVAEFDQAPAHLVPTHYCRIIRYWRGRYFVDFGIDMPDCRAAGIAYAGNCYYVFDGDEVLECVVDTLYGDGVLWLD